MSRRSPWRTRSRASAVLRTVASCSLAAVALASAPQRAAAAGGAAPSDSNTPWIRRFAPVRHQLELGVFGGLMAPSRRLELYVPRDDRPDDGYVPLRRVAPSIGARAGWFPIPHFGLELEGAAMPSRTAAGDRATMWQLGGAVVGQLGLWSVTPFVAAGAGALAVQSAPAVLGRDVDLAMFVGGGVKVYPTRMLAVRLDVRDVLAAGRGIGGVVNSVQATVGLSLVLGRPRPATPPPRKVARPRPQPVVELVVLDTDLDGIVDTDDVCVTEPETANGVSDADGCPDDVPVAVERFVGVIEGIFFATDSAVIESTSRPALDGAVELLQQHPEVAVRVVGHTDDVGDRAHNLVLSRDRAQAVADYLVRHGIASHRLEVEGVGPDQPLVPNVDERARARNRRIEFVLVPH